jgi:hypothetical protein
MTSHKSSGLLAGPMPSIDDSEGDQVPEILPPVVDAHVHLFPDHILASIWRWFDRFGWPIRYKLTSSRAIEFLLSRGIDHIVALHYAHKPGIARELKRLCEMNLPQESLDLILRRNAKTLFSIKSRD